MVDDRGIRRGVRYKHCTLIEERVRVKVPGGVMDPTYYTLVGHFFIVTFALEK